MEAKLNKAQPIWKRTWFRYLGVFIIVQLLFIICEVTDGHQTLDLAENSLIEY